MAYKDTKKKKYALTFEDKAYLQEKLNAHKKWDKPYKGEIVLAFDGCPQEFVFKARYSTNEELASDAKARAESLSALDKSKKWKVVSAKLIGQAIDDEEKEQQ